MTPITREEVEAAEAKSDAPDLDYNALEYLISVEDGSPHYWFSTGYEIARRRVEGGKGL